MRYARSAHAIARAAFSGLNGFRGKRLNVDDLPDHMLRDLGMLDGHSRYDADFSGNDARSRRLDLLTLTPYAS